jgi:hypothetical protein
MPVTDTTITDLAIAIDKAVTSLAIDNKKRGATFLKQVQDEGEWSTISKVYTWALAKSGGKQVGKKLKAELHLDKIKPMELSAIASIVKHGEWEDFVQMVLECTQANEHGESDRLAYTSIRMAAKDFTTEKLEEVEKDEKDKPSNWEKLDKAVDALASEGIDLKQIVEYMLKKAEASL